MSQIETYSTACARFTPSIPLAVLLFNMDNLPHKPPVLNVRFKGEDWGLDDHDYPDIRRKRKQSPANTASVKNAYARNRVDRFRPVMYGRPPMTSVQIAKLLPGSKRCANPTRDGARSSLSRLIKSNEVERIVRNKVVLFKWIGK